MSTGKRNRERGAELQREVVNLARKYSLQAFNRDRGGAQHEGGDVEIAGAFYGCKRKKTLAQFLKPEKQEVGVFIRENGGKPLVIIQAQQLFELLYDLSQVHQESDRMPNR